MEGGSAYRVYVLFVNHPSGRRDTWLYSSPSTQGYKARSIGRWGVKARGNFICACMYVRGHCVRAMQAASIRDTQKGRPGRISRGARTKVGGNLKKGGRSFFP